jgi:sugar/nucleoside kinase (ribokinase family)
VTDARLLSCGLTTWDIVQVVDRLPGPNEKVQALELRVGVGGPAANAARTSAALGVPTTLVTALGSGAVAELARAELTAAGVEVVDLAAGLPASPAVSTVLVTRGTGHRAVISTNAVAAPALRQAPERLLVGSTAVLFDGHHLDLAIRLAHEANEAGIATVLDGGSWKVGQEALLDAIQLAVVSADFVLPAYLGGRGIDTPDDALRRIAARGPSFVARTAGDGMVCFLHRPEARGRPALLGKIPVGAPAAPIVDTLGAGDVLHGAFAAAIAVEWAPEDALRYAMEIATASVSHPGALGWTTDAALLAHVSLRP